MSDSANTDRPDQPKQTDSAKRWIIALLAVVQAVTVCAIAYLWLIWPSQPSVSNPDATSDVPAPATTRRPAAASTPIPETERRIVEALSKPFPANLYRPDEMTFRDAVIHLATALPVPVDLDLKAFDDASIEPTTAVKLSSGQRTTGDVLDKLLSSMPQPLDWVILHGAITITTMENAANYSEVRVYDVTDLTEPFIGPNGVEWSDAAPLMDALRASLPQMDESDGSPTAVSVLNVKGRTILDARLSRRGHAELACVLATIRKAASTDSQPLPVKGPRRVAARPRAASVNPKTATQAELAAISDLVAAAPSAVSIEAVSNCNAFVCDLFRQVCERHSGNCAACPFGMCLALALLKEGASGEVESQIAHVLHAQQSADTLRKTLRGLSDRLTAIGFIPDYELVIRNQAWNEDSIPVQTEFTNALRNYYRAELVGVPFLKRPGDAGKSINGWVSAATNGRITEMIKADQIVANRIDFAVTSAVLFAGRWAHPFDPKQTAKVPFHCAGKTVDVMMMRRDREACLYGDSGGVQLLERPFRGGLLSAIVLLPPASDGAMQELEETLSIEKLKKFRSKLSAGLVNIELPRFEIQSDFRLEEPLKALGMPRAFALTSDFSKLGRPKFQLAFVRQKALLDVSEPGAQAAAAGIGAGMFGGPREKPHSFRADRPFLFLIHEKSTGLILFIARITNPETAA